MKQEISGSGCVATAEGPQRLAEVFPQLEHLLTRGDLPPPPQCAVSDIQCETVQVAMRDGARLASDLYLPPIRPAPVIVMRTPFGRAVDGNVGAFRAFARRGYIVVSQDCRGTGGSEPESWDYYMYETEDRYDTIDWISQQGWFDGFIGSCGGTVHGADSCSISGYVARVRRPI